MQVDTSKNMNVGGGIPLPELVQREILRERSRAAAGDSPEVQKQRGQAEGANFTRERQEGGAGEDGTNPFDKESLGSALVQVIRKRDMTGAEATKVLNGGGHFNKIVLRSGSKTSEKQSTRRQNNIPFGSW